MKLFCGSDLSEQTSDTLYQFEEGKKAHTIKFIPYKSEKHNNLIALNNNIINKSPPDNNIDKKIIINNELILSKNKISKDPKKISKEVSELEIIDYPIDEIEKNDFENNFNMIRAKTNNNFNINDKCQNNIINYLKCKPVYNHLKLLSNDDYSSLNSNSEDKYNIEDESSKSDEIICSYVEIENNKPLVKRAEKENSILKNTSKIFAEIHKATHCSHSFGVKFNNNSCNNKRTKKTIKKNSKIKDKSIEQKINNLKKIKKFNAHKIINKLVINKKINQLKKNFNSNENLKNFHKIFNTTKLPNNAAAHDSINFKAFNSFRTIDYQRNTTPSNKTLIKEKSNKSPRKTHKLNSDRVKNYIHVNRTINANNKVNKKDKNRIKINKINTNTQVFKTIKVISNINNNNNKQNKTKKINAKTKLTRKSNTLFNTIDSKKNIKNTNFLFSKKELTNNNLNIKTRNQALNTINFDSKGKLRKLLLNKKDNNITKPNCDTSMNNINNYIYNNMKLIIKREKYIKENKLLNKSEANKELNNRNKNNNKESKRKKY